MIFTLAAEGCALFMRKEKVKNAICRALVIACMAVIFWLSSRTADESSAQSGALLEWLIEHFGDNGFTDFIVRKLAHFLEFTGLSLLINISLRQTRGKCMPLIAAALASAYAVTDELHQLFVPGRSCQISDWAIDSCGAILGSAAFMLLYFIASAIIKRKNTVDITED